VRLLDTWIACAAAPFRRRFAADWPDALQDIRLELLRVLREGRWRGEARLKTYVWRVAAHTCIDRLRKQRRRPVHEPSPEDLDVAAEDPSPLDRVMAASGHRALLAALEAVPAECRELWRRILRGESYREISQTTGVAEGALRVRAHRCRKRAVEALDGRSAPGVDASGGGNAVGAAGASG
jgi:RNA polymerase sigma factor (sigma-70 family)